MLVGLGWGLGWGWGCFGDGEVGDLLWSLSTDG